ncbi:MULTISPECIES: S24 family peptidase [Pseudomonas]|uniref:S24 family peptidase n=1 Tax=Pseudomonas TaxID=286 RepID=UPI00257A468D|nr:MULTISPECIES: S24 family peptidase [Pseudomonas]
MDIGQRIRSARKARGLTLEELANQVDTDSGNLSRLERGKQGASQELLSRIMKALNMEVVSHIEHVMPRNKYSEAFYDNLVVVTPEENRALSNKPFTIKRYPLLTWEEAKEWHESENSCFVVEGTEFHHTTKDATEDGYWLRVFGDSMVSATCPTFPDGMLILVHPASKAEQGKYYIVKLPNGHLTFKQYMNDAGMIYLKSLNAEYKVLHIEDEIEIVGRVIDTKMMGL